MCFIAGQPCCGPACRLATLTILDAPANACLAATCLGRGAATDIVCCLGVQVRQRRDSTPPSDSSPPVFMYIRTPVWRTAVTSLGIDYPQCVVSDERSQRFNLVVMRWCVFLHFAPPAHNSSC